MHNDQLRCVRRALHAHSMQAAARRRLLVEDSSVQWVEAATSMDTVGGPERTAAVYASTAAERRSLPPLRSVRTPLHFVYFCVLFFSISGIPDDRHTYKSTNIVVITIDLQRETEEKARQPETKIGATSHTWNKAMPPNAERSRTKNQKLRHGAQSRP
jgi:hypothetical protein